METRQSPRILEKRAREEAEEDQGRNTKPRTMTNPTKHENKTVTSVKSKGQYLQDRVCVQMVQR
jgi:hypothetical protein